jgi:hypothetical protein
MIKFGRKYVQSLIGRITLQYKMLISHVPADQNTTSGLQVRRTGPHREGKGKDGGKGTVR